MKQHNIQSFRQHNIQISSTRFSDKSFRQHNIQSFRHTSIPLLPLTDTTTMASTKLRKEEEEIRLSSHACTDVSVFFFLLCVRPHTATAMFFLHFPELVWAWETDRREREREGKRPKASKGQACCCGVVSRGVIRERGQRKGQGVQCFAASTTIAVSEWSDQGAIGGYC